MRITMGSNVEVWTTDAAPQIGAWRAGEVKWGNGHSYVMRWFDDDGGPEVSGRISRKFVRPFPPDVPLPEDLAAGDIVEVLDGGLWKWAEVVAAGGKYSRFDVKIVGSSKVLTADRSELRVRQVLKEDDGWVVLHKDNEISVASAVPSRPIAGKHVKKKAIVVDGSSKFAAQAFKLGNTKRSHCMVDADIVRDVKRFQGGNANTKKLCAKEEQAARYDGNIEVIDVHPSHYLQKKKQQEIMSNDEEYCDVVGTETDSSSSSSDDDATSKSDPSSSGSGGGSSSSSGSNSGGGDQEAAIQPLPSCKKEQRDDSDGDRTESGPSARMAPHHPGHERAVAAVVKQDEQEEEPEQEQHDRVHGLELEAYVSLMKAFHASGSLTWKKEELLCHLRLLLHISSDEHLQVIWHLNGKKKPAGGPYNDRS